MTNFIITIGTYTFSLDLMTIVLSISCWILIFLLIKAQQSPISFELRDLLRSQVTGKVSLAKFGQFIALLVSTWGFIALTLNDKLTEWYFTSYMAVWAAAEGLRKWKETKENKDTL